MLLETQPLHREWSPNERPDSIKSSTAASQLLLDARRVIGSDVGAALRCIKQAVSLLEAPAHPVVVAPARGGLANWQIERIKRHVDENLDEAIHVAELAKIARLSCGYFSNAFKVSFGLSPHAYIVSCRLKRAMALMTSTGLSLCEIAIDSGFSDQAHLCRQFRRATGASPNAWRRNHAGAQAVQQ